MDLETNNIPNTPFQYSCISPVELGASEYTLVGLITDTSGSVSAYKNELVKTLNVSLDSCRKSPRAENLLIRATEFNSAVQELHGFTELAKLPDYKDLSCTGMTALYDAVYSAIGAIIDYAEKLRAMYYTVNAIIYIITDGADNSSTYRAVDIKKLVEDITKKEQIGFLTSVLIGVNDADPSLNQYLQDFKNEAGLTQYISLGDATPAKLARLAGFISKSISSSSQSLASGQPVSATTLAF